MKLNVGCAEFRKDGWTNIDIADDGGIGGLGRKPDLIASGLDLPFDDKTVERVFLGHVLEHVELPDAKVMVAEACRVLQAGGLCLIVGPDVVREAENVYHGTRAKMGERWTSSTDGFHPEHMARADWEAWTFFWGAHGTAGRGALFPMADEVGVGYVHRWSCTVEAAWLLADGAGFHRVTERPLGELADWPIVASGSPGQFALLCER